MLSKEEELRLASILGVTRIDIQRNSIWATEYKIEAVQWLALKLKEANDELKEQNKLKETIQDFVEPKPPVEFPNPLTVQYKGTTRIVAIWEKDRYVCSWCGVWFIKTESAKSHGFRHLRVVDPKDAD